MSISLSKWPILQTIVLSFIAKKLSLVTDGEGNVEEIRGPGVVGNKPFLKNGESFEYTSFCPLPTEFGVMHGYFEMFCENGKKFNAKISPFRLTVPFSIN